MTSRSGACRSAADATDAAGSEARAAARPTPPAGPAPLAGTEPQAGAPDDPARFTTPEYGEMCAALERVHAAVTRLRLVLPNPGEPVDVDRPRSVAEAERDLLGAWIRYSHLFDMVHRR